MMMLFFFLLQTLLSTIYSQSCDTSGICIDTSSQKCNGILKTGFCPGGSNILCCEAAQSCDNGKGSCLDANLQSCDGLFKSVSLYLCASPFPVIVQTIQREQC